MSLTSDASRLPSAKFGAKHTSLPRFSDEGMTLKGGHAAPDESFVRHDAYFFKDGNVTFLVRGHLCFANLTYLPAYRVMVCCTASIDTSFLAIPSTFQHDLPSSAYVTMKLSPLSYRLAMLNATISKHSSLSYILRELYWISVLTHWLPRLDYLQGF